jgi:hypothetical protein
MLRSRLVAAALALALAAGPVAAQQAPEQSPVPEKQPGVQADAALVGLPIYSSDGQRLGQIAEVGTSSGQPAVRGEMDELLGIGTRSVIIVAEVFQKKDDRIELSMTADEVKDTLSKQRQEQDKNKDKENEK